MNNEVQVAIKPIKGNLPSNLGTYEKIGPHTEICTVIYLFCHGGRWYRYYVAFLQFDQSES